MSRYRAVCPVTTPERRAEQDAHEALRDAIRQATLAQWDRRLADDDGDDESKDLHGRAVRRLPRPRAAVARAG